MVHTAQTAGGQTAKVSYTQYFDDHAGHSALRIGTRLSSQDGSNPRPPSDFTKEPTFCFQVYTSIELNLEDQQPPAKRVRGENSSPALVRSRFAALRDFLAKDLFEAQCPDPVWEIYMLPGQDAAAFVDHSRREIAHRKTQRKQGDISMPLIPKLVLGDTDDRKAAFLFGIDEHTGWKHDTQSPGEGYVSHKTHLKGPLWVHFDPRLPALVTSTEHILRLEEAPGSMGLEEDEIRVWPEQVEILVKRILNRQEAQFLLPTMLSLSCSSEAYRDEDKNLGMDFGIDSNDDNDDDDDGQRSTVASKTESRNIDKATAALGKSETGATVRHNEDTDITISTNEPNDDPDVRYVVYVPFLHQPDTINELEEVARNFTSAIEGCLSSMAIPNAKMKTLQLDFHIPLEPNDSAILASYRALQKAVDYTGALINGGNSPSSDQQPTSSDGTRPLRRHPIDINPHMTRNDPATCGFEPYKTFIIILDRPDFAAVSKDGTGGAAAVRFFLADGGKSTKSEGLDYLEMQVWRSAGMLEVVRRLTLMPMPE